MRITNATLSLNRLVVNEDETDYIQSMIQSHFPKKNENSQATKEKYEPVHDENSHYRTTYEYFIDNEPKMDGLRRQLDTPRVFVNKMSGKVQVVRPRSSF